MKISKEFYIKQQDCKVCIIVTNNTLRGCRDLYKKHNQKDPDEGYTKGFVVSWFIDQYYIMLHSEDINYTNISHEVYHLMEWISKDHNITEEESKALLIGELSGEIYKFLQTKGLI